MEPERELTFTHRFVPAARPAEAPTLLVLHGHGAHEHHLVPLARMLAPAANLLSPLGKVVEGGTDHRWWPRRPGDVFERAEVIERSRELAAFLDDAVDAYGLDGDRIVTLGLSAGACAALAVPMLNPGRFRGVIAFKPVLPFDPDPPPDLTDLPIMVVGARRDEFIPVEQTDAVVADLRRWGAQVDLLWGPFGHLLTFDDVVVGQTWVRERLPWLAGPDLADDPQAGRYVREVIGGP